MTTQADESSRKDQTAAPETSGAMNESHSAPRREKKNSGAKPQTAPVTRQLSALELEANHTPSASQRAAQVEADEGATREVTAVAPDAYTPPAPSEPYARQPQPDVAALGASDDPEATIMRAQPRPDMSSLDQPMTEPARPRYHTLASTFNRSRASASASDPAAQANRPAQSNQANQANQASQANQAAAASGPATPPPAPVAAAQSAWRMESDDAEDIVDEVDDSEDEWALADQPTVQWTPQQIQQLQRMRPSFLQTGEQPSWPSRPDADPVAPESDASHHDWRMGLPPRPRPPFPLNGAARPLNPMTANEPRLAAPNGRVAPEPPSASTAGAQPDPRMERFQELRRQRFAHGHGERTEGDPTPVADTVRQWWNDLRPNVENALHYQREARASGMHPIPAYEAATSGTAARLGDAFGRLAATAREFSERAQQAAAPTIKRIHDQVEQAAQGIISRFEGDNVRQQAPLLGPGRVAVFFRQGVTVGQAQRLLAASAARPMRLIPRKHGFLARVLPGKEAEVCERLRMHPYVRDVAYLEYNEYGEPVTGRR
ncbi:MAG TPA: hypothetical protein VF812_09885 [Ktedonobacterales bacterium]